HTTLFRSADDGGLSVRHDEDLPSVGRLAEDGVIGDTTVEGEVHALAAADAQLHPGTSRHLRRPGPSGVEDDARPDGACLPFLEIVQDHPLHPPTWAAKKIANLGVGGEIGAVLACRERVQRTEPEGI